MGGGSDGSTNSVQVSQRAYMEYKLDPKCTLCVWRVGVNLLCFCVYVCVNFLCFSLCVHRCVYVCEFVVFLHV